MGGERKGVSGSGKCTFTDWPGTVSALPAPRVAGESDGRRVRGAGAELRSRATAISGDCLLYDCSCSGVFFAAS